MLHLYSLLNFCRLLFYGAWLFWAALRWLTTLYASWRFGLKFFWVWVWFCWGWTECNMKKLFSEVKWLLVDDFSSCFQKIRPELDDIPHDLIPLLESCWADDPKIRPEFMEITSHLSNYHKQLCAAELEPPAVNVPESEPQESNVKEEEPPRVNAIDKSEEKKKVKRRKKCRSGFFFFCCRPVAVHEWWVIC